MRKNLFKTLQSIIKIVVGSGLFIMTGHVGLMLLGISEPLSEWMCGYSFGGFVMLYISSYVLNLCWKFRACLGFTFIINQCIIFQRAYGVLDNILVEALWVSFITGVILITVFCYEYLKPKTCGETID